MAIQIATKKNQMVKRLVEHIAKKKFGSINRVAVIWDGVWVVLLYDKGEKDLPTMYKAVDVDGGIDNSGLDLEKVI